MSTTSRNLNAALPWQKVLSALAAASPDRALPASVQCVLCRRHNALILADSVAGGQWYWCDGCRFGGDLIELAAAVWKLSPALTIAKLSQLGVPWDLEQPPGPAEIEAYVSGEAMRRKRRHDFVKKARQEDFLQRSTVLGKLCSGLRLRLADQTGDRWKHGAGELMLGSTAGVVEHTFQSRNSRLDRNYNPSVHRIFRGPHWKEVLAIPFSDLPGRVCGFQFVGRKGEERDSVWRFARSRSYRCAHVEAGVCYHPGTPQVADDFGGLLCSPDALLMLRLQLAQFRRSFAPLPLVAWHDSAAGRTRHGWSWWRPPLVFWDVELTPATLRQAIEQNAKISIAGSRQPKRMDDILQRDPPADFCRRLLRNAAPWRHVWSEFADEAPLDQLESLVLGYRLLEGDVESLIAVLPRRTRARLEHLSQSAAERRVTYNDKTIVETDEGWIEEKALARGARRKPIVDAILRIDSVVQLTNPRRSYYVGRVIHKGREYPFTELQSKIDANGVGWLKHFLDWVQAGRLQGDLSYNRKLADLACCFQQPKYVEGVNRVGWDANSDQFRLPKFSISSTGEFLPNPYDCLPETLPATELPPPSALFPSDVQLLTTPSPSLEAFWGAAAALAANILAPAFGRSSLGLALSGAGGTAIGTQTALAFGCPLAAAAVERAAEAEERHAWPLVIPQKSYRQTSVLAYLTEPVEQRWGVLALDWVKALAAQLGGGWRLLDVDEAAALPPEFRDSAAKLISAYLHDVCRRKLHLQSSSAVWGETVRDDLAAFVAERGGTPATVLAGGSWLRGESPTQLLESLGDLLSHWTLSGKLVAEPAAFADKIRHFTLLKLPAEEGRPEGVFLFRSVLGYLLGNHKAPPLEPERLTEIAASVLIEEGEYGGQPGWLLRADWWLSAVHRRRTARAKLLNVVG